MEATHQALGIILQAKSETVPNQNQIEADVHRAEAEASLAEGALAMVEAHLRSFDAAISALRAKALLAGIEIGPLNSVSPKLSDDSSAKIDATPKAPPPLFMKVAEYAAYRGFCKRTIETRLREGMPIEGRGRHRRVNVKKADEWFTGRGIDIYIADEQRAAEVEEKARQDASKVVHRQHAKNGGDP